MRTPRITSTMKILNDLLMLCKKTFLLRPFLFQPSPLEEGLPQEEEGQEEHVLPLSPNVPHVSYYILL